MPNALNKNQQSYDAIILGAGAAGLMCAAVAGKRGKRVLLIEHANAPGKKILISGGGRCNFTNLEVHPDRFISSNRHFAKSALARYTSADFLDLVKRHNIDWHEKTLGQLFCDGSAKQIVDMLLSECADGHVELRLTQSVTSINHADGRFHVTTTAGTPARENVTAAALVVATGGPSIPKMGATGFAYEIARQFALKVVTPRPALVPFTLGVDAAHYCALTGVACDTIVSLGQTEFREASLFTHKGLSGPAILQISSYWNQGDEISLNFLPDHGADIFVHAKKTHPKSRPQQVLARILPNRLAGVLTERLELSRELANVPDKMLEVAGQRLRHWSFIPSGTEGFAKAEVTAGGVSTADLSSKDMQATKVPGLYVIGEAVDVTGWLGGYNFQWAWASGFVAGQAL